MQTADVARLTLAAIRTTNGVLALLAPGVFTRRMGADAATDGPARYPLRLFGIRTVLIGADLVLLSGPARRRALQEGVVIHASDTVSAVFAGVRGEVPRRFAFTAAGISATNTALAGLALATGDDS